MWNDEIQIIDVLHDFCFHRYIVDVTFCLLSLVRTANEISSTDKPHFKLINPE